MHDLSKPLRYHLRLGSFRQHQRLWEQLTGYNAECRRHKRGQHVEPNHRSEPAVQL